MVKDAEYFRVPFSSVQQKKDDNNSHPLFFLQKYNKKKANLSASRKYQPTISFISD